MRNVNRAGRAGLAVVVSTLCLSACSRHEPNYGVHRYGSLKDDVITTGSTTARPARARVKRRSSTISSVTPIERAASVASAEPAPYVKAPPPVTTRAPEPPAVSSDTSGKVSIPASPPKPRAPEPPLPPVDDPTAVAQMLSEGLQLFEQGQVVQARRRFVAAMNGPVPEVLLALARSYDTYYLSRLPTADGAPDMQRALVLYERALERGATEAAPDLERTRGILKMPR